MSRFGNDDWEPDYDNAWALWEGRVKKVMSGRPGYRQLGELRQALLALPKPRLIEGALFRDGEVCAVGAYALFKRMAAGETREQAIAAMDKSLIGDDYYEDEAHQTALVGKRFGMTYTLAWTIGEQNDEEMAGLTPENRYEAMLRWIDERMAQFPVAART